MDLSKGERETVRDSGEFEITEFDIAGFNCITSHSMKNLAFPSFLIWKMIIPILATSLIHFSLKGWESVL